MEGYPADGIQGRSHKREAAAVTVKLLITPTPPANHTSGTSGCGKAEITRPGFLWGPELSPRPRFLCTTRRGSAFANSAPSWLAEQQVVFDAGQGRILGFLQRQIPFANAQSVIHDVVLVAQYVPELVGQRRQQVDLVGIDGVQ
jgi:hypothetical protein